MREVVFVMFSYLWQKGTKNGLELIEGVDLYMSFSLVASFLGFVSKIY